MVNYNNAKIYKLVNLDLGLTYYGSTSGGLKKRLSRHKSEAKTNNGKCTSKLLFEKGICKIVLVELYPTDDKTILHQRERFYIENNECVNKNVPTRTKREWRVANKEQISKQKKEWEVDNHNKRAKQKRIYRANNSDKIKEQLRIYRANNSDKIKEQKRFYRLQNADKIKERQKLYYQKNADKIKEYQNLYRAKNKLEKSSQPN
jgi:Uri superfamily endonuclease